MILSGWMFVLALSLSGSWSWATVQVELSNVGEATHLEFSGVKDWDYSISKSDPTKIQMILPRLSPEAASRLQTFSGDHLEKVEVRLEGVDGKSEVTLRLKDSKVESFDYLTDDPSRLIVDLFRQDPQQERGPVSASVGPSTPARKMAKASPAAGSPGNAAPGRDGFKKTQRRPAGSELLVVAPEEESPEAKASLTTHPEHGAFDGGDPDFSRFRIRDYEIREDAIIASRQNIYLKFPILKMPTGRLKDYMETEPEFKIEEGPGPENKEARFLLILYAKKRWSAFLKSYSYFSNRYPYSKYTEILRNLAAQTHLALWRQDDSRVNFNEARGLYKALAEKFPESVMNERYKAILTWMSHETGEALLSIQLLDDFSKEFPESKEHDNMQFALADNYMVLGKWDEAAEVYRKLIKKPLFKENAIEAKYRMGDVAFSRKNYEAAVEEYKNAHKTYPEGRSVYANSYYNMGEANFWLGRHQEALGNLVDFMKNFPSHPHSGLAMARTGELLEIMGAPQERVMGAFLEAHFRFHGSEGARVARVRMLSQQMKSMKDKEMKKGLEELEEIKKISLLPRIDEFVTLMIADGLTRRSEYDKSLSHLVTYYQQNPTTTDIDPFRKRILGNISNGLRVRLEANDYIETIKMYQGFEATWLRNSNRIDVPFFLARAYELAGAVESANRMYSEIHSKLVKMSGTQEEKERRVLEILPTADQVKLRIAGVAVQERKYGEALDYITDLKSPQSLSPESQVERAEILAEINERRGRPTQAAALVRELIEKWSEKPEYLSSAHLRLARLELAAGNIDSAERALDRLDESLTAKANLDLRAKSLEMRGDLFLRSHRPVQSVESYTQLLEEFEGSRPLGSVRYKVGQILFDRGDIKGAERVWAALADKDSFYKSLASEKLRDYQFNDEYKNYVKRIPAMQGQGGNK